jgi:hypothetical protein
MKKLDKYEQDTVSPMSDIGLSFLSKIITYLHNFSTNDKTSS